MAERVDVEEAARIVLRLMPSLDPRTLVHLVEFGRDEIARRHRVAQMVPSQRPTAGMLRNAEAEACRLIRQRDMAGEAACGQGDHDWHTVGESSDGLHQRCVRPTCRERRRSKQGPEVDSAPDT